MMRRGSSRIISCREPQAGDKGLGGWGIQTLTGKDIPFSSSSDPIYFERPKSNLVSTSLKAHLTAHCPPPPFLFHSATRSAPLYSLLMKIPDSPPDSFHPHHRLSGTEQQGSGMRVMGKHLDALLRHTQQDGYARRLLFTIAGEAKWMPAGFHLAGNLRNVRSHGE